MFTISFFDILTISETWLLSGEAEHDVNIIGFQFFDLARTSSSGGLGAYVRY